MSDAGRESIGNKIERNVIPENEKSLSGSIGDSLTQAKDSVLAAITPESQKSATQSATDKLSGNDKSLLQQAKEAVGLGDASASDPGRRGIGEKLADTFTPDSQQSTHSKIGEHADNLGARLQPDSTKSASQKISDSLTN